MRSFLGRHAVDRHDLLGWLSRFRVVSVQEPHRVLLVLFDQQALQRLSCLAAALRFVGKRGTERGEPGLRVERFSFLRTIPPDSRQHAFRLTSPGAARQLQPLARGVDGDLPHELRPEHPLPHALHGHAAGDRLLELGGETLDERVDVARLRPQRRREQIDVDFARRAQTRSQPTIGPFPTAVPRLGACQHPRMQFDEVAASVAGIPFMTPEFGRRVYDHIRETRPERALELGTAHGVSAAYIGAALEANGFGALTTVDHGGAVWDPSAEEVLDRAGVAHRVTIVRAHSSYNWWLKEQIEAASDRLGNCEPVYDFCYLDGSKNWNVDGLAVVLIEKLLRPDGWLLMDDLEWTYKSNPGIVPSGDGLPPGPDLGQ